MIFDTSATPLLNQFKLAKEVEAAASKQLLAALESGVRDQAALLALVTHMEEATSAAAAIWAQLQAVAVGE